MKKDFVQMDLFGGDLSETAPIGSSRYVEPFVDGIEPDDFEDIHVLVHKKSLAKMSISIAQGKSGNWYFGISTHYKDGGSAYAAWPKFSDRYTSRYHAISAAVIKIIKWFHDRKPAKGHMDLVLAALAEYTDTLDTGESLSGNISWNDQQRLAIAKRDGVSPDCKHLSIWSKTVCSDDCDDCKAGCIEPKALEG